MKLTRLKELIEQMPELDEKWAETYNAYQANPDDMTLKRKHALAAAQYNRAIRTVENYSPTFTVSLGQFADCSKEVFDAVGVASDVACVNFNEIEYGKVQANVVLTLNDKLYNLFKVVLENENQPLADVKVNLLHSGMLKGVKLTNDNDELEEYLNTIAWNAITKKILAEIEEKKQAKAIKEEKVNI